MIPTHRVLIRLKRVNESKILSTASSTQVKINGSWGNNDDKKKNSRSTPAYRQMGKNSKSNPFNYKMEMNVYFIRLLEELNGCYSLCSKCLINAGFFFTPS